MPERDGYIPRGRTPWRRSAVALNARYPCTAPTGLRGQSDYEFGLDLILDGL
jgi:hypothetical protein